MNKAWKECERKGSVEARPYSPGEDLRDVSVNAEDVSINETLEIYTIDECELNMDLDIDLDIQRKSCAKSNQMEM